MPLLVRTFLIYRRKIIRIAFELKISLVGDIPPQSYIPSPSRASKSTSKSRDDLSYQTDGKIEPMTKTVSRSVSMLAPWRPKHKSEGYEIDYSRRVNMFFVTIALIIKKYFLK